MILSLIIKNDTTKVNPERSGGAKCRVFRRSRSIV